MFSKFGWKNRAIWAPFNPARTFLNFYRYISFLYKRYDPCEQLIMHKLYQNTFPCLIQTYIRAEADVSMVISYNHRLTNMERMICYIVDILVSIWYIK